MAREEFYFKGKEDINLKVYKWNPKSKAKAVIQIAHGMAETALRYEEFAHILNENGYRVYANDHRGHGESCKKLEELGYLGEQDGFFSMIKDMNKLTSIIEEENKDLPIYLFGHSMGSFLSQRYIQLYGDRIQGLILSGTNGKQGSMVNLGILIAKLEMILKGRKHKSNLLNKLSFDRFNKSFKPNKTDFDWLSRDEKEVQKYIKNPYCGTVFTTSYFYDFFRGLKSIWKEENIKKIPKNLPMFIVAGSKDPVGNDGQGIENLYNCYKLLGVKNIKYKLYKDGRHEILNEINKKEVFKDIISWINKQHENIEV
ncbi:alpha/beta hydrolase [Clostridium niameyense]|uniref:Alpha/beta hydrolase n=1 Tax=Clostridium niameyense TaxID=1622073 RepID=A0A6M0RCR6_9CLOT|nr:alpha/beta hydrolase [Clostridium niameyense]NEZ47510.1 alpha/beta hydrolase [Clostridium niameyense]